MRGRQHNPPLPAPTPPAGDQGGAGGLGIALTCDLRIARETAVFKLFGPRFGVPMSDASTVGLRLIGLGRALDLHHTGHPVGAQEALWIGLADRVVPAGTARAAAEELAKHCSRTTRTPCEPTGGPP